MARYEQTAGALLSEPGIYRKQYRAERQRLEDSGRQRLEESERQRPGDVD